MLAWARSSLSMVALVLVACAPSPEEVVGMSTSSDASGEPTTGAGPGSLTQATTAPADESGDSSSRETTSGTTTTGAAATTDESTASSGSSSGPAPGCMGPEDCGSNQDCVGERCVDACGGAWGMGSYGYCLNEFGAFATSTLCGADHLCVYWGDPIEQAACASQGCTSACDCPPPPATGTAVVTCSDITDPDELPDCYLSCANGEVCPDGMSCTANGACAASVPLLPVYGDCGNLAGDCEPPALCVAVPGGESVCTTTCTDAAIDCPMAAPAGGSADVACTDIVPDEPGFECYLDCIGGVPCPSGMECINGTLCMWST